MSDDLADFSTLAQPIQDQGQCGSCTAFGLTGVIEALYFQKYGKHVKLSERDLFFCSGGSCERGNTMEAPLNYARDTGVATEECCPYGDVSMGRNHYCGDGRCGSWYVDGVRIASWKRLTDPAEIDAAMRAGPVYLDMAVPQSFMNYTGGVYHSLGLNDRIIGYHAIGGFGKNFTRGWIEGRNSWSPNDWGEESLSNHIAGEKGWLRMQQNDARLEIGVYQVTIDGPIPPTPPPPPSPCQFSMFVVKLPGGRWFLRHYRAIRKKLFDIDPGVYGTW